MKVNRVQVLEWLEEAKQDNQISHVFIVWDSSGYESYPLFVKESENVYEVERDVKGAPGEKILEIYSMKLDIEEQLKEPNVFHYNKE